MERLRVVIADDHRDVLAALVAAVESDRRFVVVGTASSGTEASRRAGDGDVDLVLLDVRMQDGGATAARRISALTPAPAVVAISAETDAATVLGMLDAGAVGYLAKGSIGDALPDLLFRCARGEVVLAVPSAAAALRRLLEAGGGHVAEHTDSGD